MKIDVYEGACTLKLGLMKKLVLSASNSAGLNLKRIDEITLASYVSGNLGVNAHGSKCLG